MKKFLLITILIYSFPIVALDLSILLQVDYYGDLEPTTSYESLRSRLYTRPEVTGIIIDNFLDFHLSANLFYQPIGNEPFIQLDNILRETYLRFKGSFYNFYLGQRFVNWGKVDFFSPINVINPIDTRVLSLDNLDEGRLPVLMADLMINIGYATSLEIIYEPFFRPYYYPDEQLDIEFDFFTIDIDTSFYHKEVPYLSREAHSLFVALNYWSYWFDLLLSYSYYLDPYPDFDLSGISQKSEPTVFFTKYIIRGEAYNTYNRAHLIGLGASTNIKDWGFDIESGLKITEDWYGVKVETKNSELITNIQVNKNFFYEWFTQLNIIYRYIINYDAKLDSKLKASVLSSLETELQKRFLQPVQSSIYIVNHIHRYILHDTLYFALNGGLGFPVFSQEEYELEVFLALRGAYSFTDLVKLETGVDFYFQGEEAGYIGRNKLKDNFYIRIIMAID